MRLDTMQFTDSVAEKMLMAKEPMLSTWAVHKLVYGKGYDRPSGYPYRKLLKALNYLEDNGKVWAVRTDGGTVWMLKMRDIRQVYPVSWEAQARGELPF